MSYEDRALEKLDGAVKGGLDNVARAAFEVRGCQHAYNVEADFTAIMQATISMIIACEDLATAASDAERKCRAALAEAMALGATTVKTEHHIASLRAATKRAVVTDQAAIPVRFMYHPQPKPDLTCITAHLRAGQLVPGAVLSNGGPDTLTIRNRKDNL